MYTLAWPGLARDDPRPPSRAHTQQPIIILGIKGTIFLLIRQYVNKYLMRTKEIYFFIIQIAKQK